MSESAVIENNDNDDDFLTQEEINQDVLDKYNFLVACSSARVGKPNLFDRLGVIYRSIFK
jgi:hypothetical protein